MQNNWFTKQFWAATVERAIKTFAQSMAALLTTSAVGLFEIDWLNFLSISAVATIASVLTSVVSGSMTGGETSVTRAELIATPAVVTALKETDENKTDEKVPETAEPESEVETTVTV
ncbi:MAG: holin [Propionibacteriaceae bacterium]|jgi:hypothetical protein|nr:holin [Propionibacteriaceae bacterium]